MNKDRILAYINQRKYEIHTGINSAVGSKFDTERRLMANRLDELLQLEKSIKSEPEEPIIEMVDYEGEPVPKELCTIDREGGADDFLGCGACFETENHINCSDCPIDKLFKRYAALTGQGGNNG